MRAAPPTVIAIPIRNEERHLPACLQALAAQTRPADVILLLLNNCTDASLRIAHHARRLLGNIQIVECRLDEETASAGEARRLAFEHALDFAGDGAILTTDADTTVPPGWVADNLAALAAGADCVCGKAVIAPEPDGASRPRLRFDDMREHLLLGLQDEITAMIDPDPYDPWPRHQQHSGASIAVRAATLRHIGGAPHIATGEDRALIAKLALFDARIRHAPHIEVSVSGRQVGRAAGGMAETIMRRLQRRDWLTDEALEPTIDAYRRALARASLRAARHSDPAAGRLATDLCIGEACLRTALASRHFGTAWDQVQRLSPVLQRRRVAFADLARETRQALALRGELCRATQPGLSLVAE